MPRFQEMPVRARVSADVYTAVERFAVSQGLVSKDGSPNVSAATRLLIAIGLDSGDGARIARASFENARSDLLQRLYRLVSERYQGIAEELL